MNSCLIDWIMKRVSSFRSSEQIKHTMEEETVEGRERNVRRERERKRHKFRRTFAAQGNGERLWRAYLVFLTTLWKPALLKLFSFFLKILHAFNTWKKYGIAIIWTITIYLIILTFFICFFEYFYLIILTFFLGILIWRSLPKNINSMY